MSLSIDGKYWVPYKLTYNLLIEMCVYKSKFTLYYWPQSKRQHTIYGYILCRGDEV